MSPLRIVIFAKAPLPGYAKTRLIPELGAEGAAKLAARMLHHSVQQALSANLGTVELCVAPDINHPIWPTLTLPDWIQWTAQGEGDLGARMSRATQRVIEAGESILLIGTDCPALTSQVLQTAAQALDRAPIKMVPALDGGYTLLGLSRYDPSLFIDIPWSTSAVAELTRQRAAALGWEIIEHQPLNDIDQPEDLRWLPRSFLE